MTAMYDPAHPGEIRATFKSGVRAELKEAARLC